MFDVNDISSIRHLGIFAGIPCLALFLTGCHDNPADISDSPVRSMKIQSWEDSGIRIRVVKKGEPVERLLAFVRSAERVNDHKCGSTAMITITHEDGTLTELSISPGHSSRHVEFRYDGMPYRVARDDVVEAFVAMNLDPKQWIPEALE